MTVGPIYSFDGFSLAVPSQSGRVFALEYKDPLADSDWIALPLVAGIGAVLAVWVWRRSVVLSTLGGSAAYAAIGALLVVLG